MPNVDDLCRWLRHNVDDLRLAPDMVTEAGASTVRFRWHGIAHIQGAYRGLGIDLLHGPSLGEAWMYGYGARGVRVLLHGASSIPEEVRVRLRRILVSHLDDPERDWGRGRRFFGLRAQATA